MGVVSNYRLGVLIVDILGVAETLGVPDIDVLADGVRDSRYCRRISLKRRRGCAFLTCLCGLVLCALCRPQFADLPSRVTIVDALRLCPRRLFARPRTNTSGLLTGFPSGSTSLRCLGLNSFYVKFITGMGGCGERLQVIVLFSRSFLGSDGGYGTIVESKECFIFSVSPESTAFLCVRQYVVVALLCLFASKLALANSMSMSYYLSEARISSSMGMRLQPTMSPSGISNYSVQHQTWFLICSMSNLVLGSVFRIPASKFVTSGESHLGVQYFPAMIFLYSFDVLGSSKGRYPHIIAKSTTPQDQISALYGSYFSPLIISGAAQHGLPHAVWRYSPGLQVLPSPKSMILIFYLLSSRRFSGFKSRWTIPSLCT